ncbi:MAG: energy transducer TonB [Gemmatimonadaceae bacterium]|jgi:protein TonB|nr:energy transducer TonB [Gemmatimonadota bacterium]MBP9947762.1 energy transducer TonB [Vicinamibacteria bacterium]MCC7322726.1 energy transducer TonB [Gemmatimonadaceae bacterium]MBK7835415.1 energy transducer TonB [Gemmatimonadota bacterium]MBK8061807.1 energy transducer TonB [Gemmatimonadota bacterium]
MFNNLVESKRKKQRSPAGLFASFVLHAALITLVVVAGGQAAEQFEKPKQEKVDFVEVKKDEPPPPKNEPPPPPPPDVVAAPPPPKGFQILTAPVDIPDVLPDIDLSKKVTDEADFSGKGAAGGTAKGVEGGKPQLVGANNDQPFFEFQVEKPVQALPGGSSPRYPDILRQAGVEGEVLAQFVVDTTGRAEMNSYKVLKTTHELFGNAVKQALPGMRFIPAEVGGRKVRQLVQQPFSFAISK